jgi:predicted glycogen debranching enzyme
MTRFPLRRLRFGPERPPGHSLEWIVTNGLGGYASGPVAGGLTRRFHGLLIAALPAPLGRLLCLNHLGLSIVDGTRLIVVEREHTMARPGPGEAVLEEFALERGLPVWRYRADDLAFEKRIVMPHGENTTHVLFRMIDGADAMTLRLRPAFQVRPHEASLASPAEAPARFDRTGGLVEIHVAGTPVVIRWRLDAAAAADFHFDQPHTVHAEYAVEAARGYDHRGALWSPGWVDITITRDAPASFVVSTEARDALLRTSSVAALEREQARREDLIALAGAEDDGFLAELTLAADQFVVSPVGRAEDIARARASGDEPRTVIAGYHWFTDWGRDTMIALEGLTIATGRAREAGWILRTFAHYVRDGLIPNLFPEGERLGLYHTADATLWFFHALHRYLACTRDRATLAALLPTLVDIAEHHVAGTHFGIGVDEADGLLRQGADGYQLTWMDAKVGDWVVTPRRGKAVEINALWYNALRLLAGWLADSGRKGDAGRWRSLADRAATSFNARFWNAEAPYLFDVVDGEQGDDAACRPNQIFAISLDHPVLDPARWATVLEVITKQLVTPVGLRSLAPNHPAYQPVYDGDLRARDAAYHQGTVWAWLIGPFIDAWLRVHPDDRAGARAYLGAFSGETASFGVGTIGEIFDAELPYTPRGCIAQAWSVAEVLRAYRRTR